MVPLRKLDFLYCKLEMRTVTKKKPNKKQPLHSQRNLLFKLKSSTVILSACRLLSKGKSYHKIKHSKISYQYEVRIHILRSKNLGYWNKRCQNTKENHQSLSCHRLLKCTRIPNTNSELFGTWRKERSKQTKSRQLKHWVRSHQQRSLFLILVLYPAHNRSSSSTPIAQVTGDGSK